MIRNACMESHARVTNIRSTAPPIVENTIIENLILILDTFEETQLKAQQIGEVSNHKHRI